MKKNVSSVVHGWEKSIEFVSKINKWKKQYTLTIKTVLHIHRFPKLTPAYFDFPKDYEIIWKEKA